MGIINQNYSELILNWIQLSESKEGSLLIVPVVSLVSQSSGWQGVFAMASSNYDSYYEQLVARLQSNFVLSRMEDKKQEEKLLEGKMQ